MRKDVAISLRISPEMKRQVADLARLRGEAEAVVVRDALRAHFARAEKGDGASLVPSAISAATSRLNEAPVKYRIKRKKP